MASNTYFEFRNNGNWLEIILHVGSNKKPIRAEDVKHCLETHKIQVDDIIALNKFIASGSDGAVMRIGPAIVPFNDWCEYEISQDLMQVTAIHYAGFVGMSKPGIDEIKKDLQQKKVVFGIDDDAILRLIGTENYMESIVVANGVKQIEGKDAVLNYCFDTEKQARPTIKEDGTVDYHNMDGLNHVKEGDVVATITPLDRGVAGKDVCGREILPARVKNVSFKFGRNMRISEDGLSLIATTNGHVTLEGGKIFVSNVLEVVDVDNSTGDIQYDGDVVVSGNVLAGFSVKATGNIEIRGVVEGAYVEAGGNITMVRGVQGMNRAQIIAGGNIVTKFIESADNVSAGGDLEADTLLHSRVSVKGKIKVEGRNGLIIGGDVRSIHGISARTIGNEMGTATVVGVGVDPALHKEIDQLKKSIAKEDDNKDKLNQVVATLQRMQRSGVKLDAAKKEMLQQTTRNKIMIEQNIKKMRCRLNEATQLISDDDKARIKIELVAYSGTKLVFGEISYFIKDRVDHCQFVKKGADIKSLPL